MTAINNLIDAVLTAHPEDGRMRGLAMEARAALENPGASQAAKARELAEMFHSTYERLAPEFGYETRKDTRAFDPSSPNGKLMTAVCAEILASLPQEPARPARPTKVVVKPDRFEVSMDSGERVTLWREPEPASQEAEKLKVATHWIYHAPHGDNCYLTDEGDGSTCTCGKESVLSFLESDAIPEPASQEAKALDEEARKNGAVIVAAIKNLKKGNPKLALSLLRTIVETPQAVQGASVKQSLTVEQAVPLTNEQFDLIASDGMRNAAGGIYATSVYEFARAVIAEFCRINGITAPEGEQQ